MVVNSNLGDRLILKHTETLLNQLPLTSSATSTIGVEWGRDDNGIYVKHSKPVQQVCWHGKGDYFAAVTNDGEFM